MENIFNWLNELFASLKSKVVLSSGLTYSFIDPITIFAKFFYNLTRKKWWGQLHDLGVAVAKNEEGLYTFLYKNEEIANSLSKSEVESYLKDLFSKTRKSADEATAYLDDLVEGKKLEKLILEIPGIKRFTKWFNDIEIEDFEILWRNRKIKIKISNLIRHPGGLHEWLMCSRANVFKKWGVTMEEIKLLRSKIDEVIFTNPPGYHGGPGSTKAHNEILALIDGSKNYADFKTSLIKWSETRLQGGSKSLPNGFFE